MTEQEAGQLQAVLAARYPRGDVTVTPERDGATVAVAGDGSHAVYTVSDGPSRLLWQLLARNG